MRVDALQAQEKAGLASGTESSAPDAHVDLERRVEALEAEVAELKHAFSLRGIVLPPTYPSYTRAGCHSES